MSTYEQVLAQASAVLAQMGGEARVGPQWENLCRRARPDERRTGSGPDWIVESEGLPNLIHELVHALFLGELADDHGFDYGQIPLDLRVPIHRGILWEELTCCVVSAACCAPLAADPRTFQSAWFAEQFEIQGVFHGLEADLPEFRAHIDAALGREEWARERRTTLETGYSRLADALVSVGGEPWPRLRPSILDVWRIYRSAC